MHMEHDNAWTAPRLPPLINALLARLYRRQHQIPSTFQIDSSRKMQTDQSTTWETQPKPPKMHFRQHICDLFTKELQYPEWTYH